MADVIQAAKWIEEGKRTRRPVFSEEISIGVHGTWLCVFVYGTPRGSHDTAPFNTDDLLADDWEIA